MGGASMVLCPATLLPYLCPFALNSSPSPPAVKDQQQQCLSSPLSLPPPLSLPSSSTPPSPPPLLRQAINNVVPFYADPQMEVELDRRIAHIVTHKNALMGHQTWGSLSSVVFGLEVRTAVYIIILPILCRLWAAGDEGGDLMPASTCPDPQFTSLSMY